MSQISKMLTSFSLISMFIMAFVGAVFDCSFLDDYS